MEFVQRMPLELLAGWEDNYRTGDIPAIKKSLATFGMLGALRVRGATVMAGNQTLAALKELKSEGAPPPRNVTVDNGEWLVPTISIAHLSDSEAAAFAIADNRTHDLGTDDEAQLAALLKSLGSESSDLLAVTGYEGDDLLALLSEVSQSDELKETSKVSGALSERFLMPPFTVFDARSAAWQERKRYWVDEGIRSEVGRAENLIFSRSSQAPAVYKSKNALEEVLGRELTWPEFFEMSPDQEHQKGTSIFDPVLCELVYRWFCPSGGTVLDPFAGGCVRGVVADRLGLSYVGIDVREEQIAANREVAPDSKAQWILGDSQRCQDIAPGNYDLIFTCPPYGDLERYSDLDADISTMEYSAFIRTLSTIIERSVEMLTENRFAVFVVGEFRDKKGVFRGFVPDVIRAFQNAGATYYNEGVLITNSGSLAIRAGRTFSSTRKLGKTHQNVLVFLKGDAKKATKACGQVQTEIPELEVLTSTLETHLDGGSVAA